MTTPNSESANHDEDNQRPFDDLVDPLAIWARVVALVLGGGAAGLGSYAVFVSNNQAGTAVLLAVGIVLLLLGLQGAPLRSFGGGEYRIELARIRRRAVEVVDEAARSGSPEVAAAVAEAVSEIDPFVARARPAGHLYLNAVRHALARVGASVDAAHRDGRGDRGVDIRAECPRGKVNVAVKYRSRGYLDGGDMVMASSALRSSGFDGGYLLVTNAPLSADANVFYREHSFKTLPESGIVEIVTWQDERDDEILERALTRNAR